MTVATHKNPYVPSASDLPLMGLSVVDNRSYHLTMGAVQEASKVSYLDTAQRPLWLQNKIEALFESIRNQAQGKWGYNGTCLYNLCGINEHRLVQQLILKGYPSQKEFTFLDVGAGRFEWGMSLVEQLNQDPEIPSDATYHVIGVSGELGSTITRCGKCYLHNLGGFKIEEIGREFESRGFRFTNQIDFAISRLTLFHLKDGPGTFVDICNLLRPGTGIFIMDGFYFNTAEIGDNANFRQNLIQLLIDGKVKFLRLPNRSHAFDAFCIQRDLSPVRLPIRYVDENRNNYCFAYSEGADLGDKCKLVSRDKDAHCLSGDKLLYDCLKQEGIVEAEWKPIESVMIPAPREEESKK